ncbi:hypothetical protein FMEXI_5850 [Fusarium mexicanum]|uniref:Uncharacterized protein n=1 Tax=Fusarium mexicanum TaxID=751941 RepID=A0A8H5MYL5_9HYPO|nr:hypothetical protein FMEXI_5850 [Fusarium mexicanum]
MQFNIKTALAIFAMASVASAQQQCVETLANNQCPASHPKFCAVASVFSVKVRDDVTVLHVEGLCGPEGARATWSHLAL